MNNKHIFTTIALLFYFLIGPVLSTARGQEPDANVNSRYTVENVRLSGVSESKVNKQVLEDMQKLVGEKYNEKATDDLAKRLRKELPDFSVNTKVGRGEKADHVKVVFEAERRWFKKFDIGSSKLVYHSKEGWSGRLSASFDAHHSVFTVGGVNSADDFLERNAGLLLGFEQQKVGTDRLRLRMAFESYHSKWNPATEFNLRTSPGVPGVYRSRQNFAPALALLPWRDLQISVGTSFERLQTQYPTPHTNTAYAGTLAVSLHHRFESSGRLQQRISAEYSLRSATKILDSDFIYTRHAAEARYTAILGRHYFGVHGLAGGILGVAPLFERFTLGNSTMLRGWNKFDVAPLGGSRVAYGSLEYRYSGFEIFYDAGAVWDRGQPAKARHAAGFGWADRHGAFFLLGFPLRLQQVAPIVTFGIRF